MMTIRSGSNANCVYIQNGSYGILVDVGAGIRTVEKALAEVGRSPREIAAIFITHEHSDHIAGLAALTKKYPIPIFANDATAEAICLRYPELDPDLFVSLPTGRSAVCPDLEVSSFKTSHDAAESVGYTITDGRKKISIATDLGVMTETVLQHIRQSDAILLESNYDEDMLRFGSYPPPLKQRILSRSGHLSNEDCSVTAALLAEQGTSRIILGHISIQNNTADLAYSVTQKAMEEKNIRPNEDVQLSLAPRKEQSDLWEV